MTGDGMECRRRIQPKKASGLLHHDARGCRLQQNMARPDKKIAKQQRKIEKIARMK